MDIENISVKTRRKIINKRLFIHISKFRTNFGSSNYFLPLLFDKIMCDSVLYCLTPQLPVNRSGVDSLEHSLYSHRREER